MTGSDTNRASARILIKAEEYIYIIAGYILAFAAAGLLITSVWWK